MKNRITLSDLKAALSNREFELHYQPKVSMVTGRLCGAEALVRWRKNSGQLVPPMDFIPLAEETNFITEITRYVFGKIVVDYAFINSVDSSLTISFNASGRDFYNENLTRLIVDAVNGRLIEAGSIEIEVTETVLVEEKSARRYLDELSNCGISIAMDDFGTGHSGLVELSKWPFSILKIDKKFIWGMTSSDKDREILQASIRMAHQLNMDVVAEGIEDEETFRVLQEYGCKIGQGFWISKPLPLQEFITFIKKFVNLPAMPIGLLYMAQLDHIQWKKTLIDTALFLHGSGENRPLENVRGCPQLDHTRCKLGLWYYGEGVTFRDLPGYSQLEQPHRELHRIGNELLQAARGGCALEELSLLIQKLSEKSIRVLESLQLLENYLHVNDRYLPAPAAVESVGR